MRSPNEVLIRPVISEKGSDLKSQNKYIFEISERESDYKWIKNFIISLKD